MSRLGVTRPVVGVHRDAHPGVVDVSGGIPSLLVAFAV